MFGNWQGVEILQRKKMNITAGMLSSHQTKRYYNIYCGSILVSDKLPIFLLFFGGENLVFKVTRPTIQNADNFKYLRTIFTLLCSSLLDDGPLCQIKPTRKLSLVVNSVEN